MDGRFCSYLRVSTDKQGQSQLGIEAQRSAIAHYLNGGDHELLGEFVEVESGKRADNRPMLRQAIDTCKRKGAILIVAKWDRLSRNSAFVNNILESDLEVIAADNPLINKLVVRILAAVNQDMRERISTHTKEALAAAKARGVKLGSPKGISRDVALKGAVRSMEERHKKAEEHARRIYPVIKELKDQGLSLRGIAQKLCEGKELTPRGTTKWHGRTVKYVLDRVEKEQ